MTNIVIVHKNSSLTTSNVKKICRENLYKKCNFRKSDGFSNRTTWNVTIGDEKHSIELWARDFGNANTANKYDFHPPCDNALYFGDCCLIKTEGDDIVDLDVPLWNKIYEKLFGGFEDLNDNETESDDELEDIPKHLKTKDGYLKDNFVVDTESEKKDSDDGSCEEGEEESDSSDDSDNSELEEEFYEYSTDDE